MLEETLKFRATLELKEKLQKLAEKEHRSVGSVIRLLLESALSKRDQNG